MTKFYESPIKWAFNKVFKKENPGTNPAFNSAFNINSQQTANSTAGSGGGGASSVNKSRLLAPIALFSMVFVYLLNSVYFVDEKENAVVLLNGKYVETRTAGIHVLPAPFYSAEVYDTETILALSVGNESLTVEEDLALVGFTLQYKITDAYRYFMASGDSLLTFELFLESSAKAVIADMTLDDALTDKRPVVKALVVANINKHVNVDTYGIDVVDVTYELSRAPDAVQNAYKKAVTAREVAQGMVNDAENYQNGVIPDSESNAKKIEDKAKAYAKQMIEKANGDVAGFNDLLPHYRESPTITKQRMYYAAMADILRDKKKVIYDLNDSSSNQLNHLDINQLLKK
ncbi:FtsH protease activity modulator HflK [Vibrio sp. Makdt]|uniref:FtsH protease activity modulator HflK n=1 Tax=Vibrio sp. Makdt TaxID=2998828 RepID=UPI0022CD25B7|nr:FtsH protease activity modulator HflK [Vibrio sp. Makdt]MDA0152179.1 FtsH protease activity modulator HflK [Vibrio sp. Makdt]